MLSKLRLVVNRAAVSNAEFLARPPELKHEASVTVAADARITLSPRCNSEAGYGTGLGCVLTVKRHRISGWQNLTSKFCQSSKNAFSLEALSSTLAPIGRLLA